MFERFTPQARAAIVAGQEEARQHRGRCIAPVHMLVGLANVTGSDSRAVLGLTDSERWSVRRSRWERLLRPSEERLPFHVVSKEVVIASVQLADDAQCPVVSSGHLLLALLEAGDKPSARLLARQGVDASTLARRVDELTRREYDVIEEG